MNHIDTTGGDVLDAAQQAEIKSIVCEILELDEDEVTEDSLFKENHGADSLRAIEIWPHWSARSM
jgi:acyl carrier protein